MNKTLALLLCSAMAQTAIASTTFGVGGIIDGQNSNSTLTGVLTHRYESGPLQQEFDASYMQQTSNGDRISQRTELFGKINYALTSRHYAQFSSRYVDTLGEDSRLVAGIGHGFKLVRTENLKISNELTLGKNLVNSKDTVIADSIWIRYKLDDKNSVTNKFLVEVGDTTRVQNVLEVEHALDSRIALSLSHTEVRSDVDVSLSSFNIKVAF